MSPSASPARIDTALVWLRRDLRVDDHAALYHALTAAQRALCVFVFDRAILDALAGDHGAALDDFALLRRGNRLSVLPVSAAQWKHILQLENQRR